MGELQRLGLALISKRFDVWRNLYSKFELDPGAVLAARAELATFIVPVVDVDSLLDVITVEAVTIVSDVSALVTAFTIPDNERWEFMSMHAQRNSGDRTADAFVGETPESATLGPDMYMFNVSASSTIFTAGSGKPYMAIELPPKAIVSVRFSSAGATDGNWFVKATVRKREVRSSD